MVHTDGRLTEALDRARLNGMPWSGIVHCEALDATPTPAMTEATLRAEPVPGAKSLIEVVRSLDASAWPGDPKLWIVTRGATAVHDADRPTLALAQTPVRGLARVIEAEQPTRYASCVDLDAAATLPEQVVQFEAELVYGGDEPAVSLRGDKRFVQRLMRLSPTPNDSCVNFRADSSYLITGGLGGIGLFVSRWMIAQGVRHLIIIGRTPIPPREHWRDLESGSASPAGERVKAIRELEALGAAIHYFPVDVSDPVALAAILGRWRAEARLPIKGIVHTAAVIDDQLLTQLEPDSIGRVFGAKAVGAWLLKEALVETDWCVFFSSMASIWPAPGHANYAAANAFLDGLSQYGKGAGKRMLSVGWGLWSDIGFAATAGGREAQRRFAEQGVHGFSPSEGLRALEILLASGVPHAVVMNTDRECFARAHSGLAVQPLLRGLSEQSGISGASSTTTNADAVPFIEQYRQADAAQRGALMQRRVARHVADVLKYHDLQIDTHRPLGEYGLNSIMGLELRHNLERELSLRLSATIIWNYPSVAALATYLQTRVDAKAAAAAEPSERATGKCDIDDKQFFGETSAITAKVADEDTRLRQLEQLSDEAVLHALRVSKSKVTR